MALELANLETAGPIWLPTYFWPFVFCFPGVCQVWAWLFKTQKLRLKTVNGPQHEEQQRLWGMRRGLECRVATQRTAFLFWQIFIIYSRHLCAKRQHIHTHTERVRERGRDRHRQICILDTVAASAWQRGSGNLLFFWACVCFT